MKRDQNNCITNWEVQIALKGIEFSVELLPYAYVLNCPWHGYISLEGFYKKGYRLCVYVSGYRFQHRVTTNEQNHFLINNILSVNIAKIFICQIHCFYYFKIWVIGIFFNFFFKSIRVFVLLHSSSMFLGHWELQTFFPFLFNFFIY